MSITLKSKRELARMRQAGRIVAEVHDLMRERVAPGVTTVQLNDVAHQYILESGGYPSFLGYGGFPASICTSVNEQIVHGIPGDRVLREGDIVSIDVGVIFDGFHGDAARTYAVGSITNEHQRLIKAAEAAFNAGMEYAVDGGRLGDLGAAIEACSIELGFDVVREYVGHGIGREMHEDPQIPNYGESGTGRRLRRGMTLAVEPMLNIGGAGTRVLDDEWTVVTESGGYSAHYENTVLVTDGAPEILTQCVETVIE